MGRGSRASVHVQHAELEYYVRGWSVVEKVQRAKLDGTYESTIETARSPAQRLSGDLAYRLSQPVEPVLESLN
jgi:hypothetical protein